MTPDETFLTPAEVARLTGTSIKARQVQHLRSQCIHFYTNIKGEPVVPRQVLTGTPAAAPPKPAWSPAKRYQRGTNPIPQASNGTPR